MAKEKKYNNNNISRYKRFVSSENPDTNFIMLFKAMARRKIESYQRKRTLTNQTEIKNKIAFVRKYIVLVEKQFTKLFRASGKTNDSNRLKLMKVGILPKPGSTFLKSSNELCRELKSIHEKYYQSQSDNVSTVEQYYKALKQNVIKYYVLLLKERPNFNITTLPQDMYYKKHKFVCGFTLPRNSTLSSGDCATRLSDSVTTEPTDMTDGKQSFNRL